MKTLSYNALIVLAVSSFATLIVATIIWLLTLSLWALLLMVVGLVMGVVFSVSAAENEVGVRVNLFKIF